MTNILAALLGLIINQPYSLTVDRATPQLIEICRADENCMDLEEVDGCSGDMDCCKKFGFTDCENI